MKYTLVGTYHADAHLIGMGNHVEKVTKEFDSLEELLRYCYRSPWGCVSSGTSGAVLMDGAPIGRVSPNRWYSVDGYSQEFNDRGRFTGEKYKE